MSGLFWLVCSLVLANIEAKPMIRLKVPLSPQSLKISNSQIDLIKLLSSVDDLLLSITASKVLMNDEAYLKVYNTLPLDRTKYNSRMIQENSGIYFNSSSLYAEAVCSKNYHGHLPNPSEAEDFDLLTNWTSTVSTPFVLVSITYQGGLLVNRLDGSVIDNTLELHSLLGDESKNLLLGVANLMPATVSNTAGDVAAAKPQSTDTVVEISTTTLAPESGRKKREISPLSLVQHITGYPMALIPKTKQLVVVVKKTETFPIICLIKRTSGQSQDSIDLRKKKAFQLLDLIESELKGYHAEIGQQSAIEFNPTDISAGVPQWILDAQVLLEGLAVLRDTPSDIFKLDQILAALQKLPPEIALSRQYLDSKVFNFADRVCLSLASGGSKCFEHDDTIKWHELQLLPYTENGQLLALDRLMYQTNHLETCFSVASDGMRRLLPSSCCLAIYDDHASLSESGCPFAPDTGLSVPVSQDYRGLSYLDHSIDEVTSSCESIPESLTSAKTILSNCGLMLVDDGYAYNLRGRGASISILDEYKKPTSTTRHLGNLPEPVLWVIFGSSTIICIGATVFCVYKCGGLRFCRRNKQPTSTQVQETGLPDLGESGMMLPRSGTCFIGRSGRTWHIRSTPSSRSQN